MVILLISHTRHCTSWLWIIRHSNDLKIYHRINHFQNRQLIQESRHFQACSVRSLSIKASSVRGCGVCCWACWRRRVRVRPQHDEHVGLAARVRRRAQHARARARRRAPRAAPAIPQQAGGTFASRHQRLAARVTPLWKPKPNNLLQHGENYNCLLTEAQCLVLVWYKLCLNLVRWRCFFWIAQVLCFPYVTCILDVKVQNTHSFTEERCFLLPLYLLSRFGTLDSFCGPSSRRKARSRFE